MTEVLTASWRLLGVCWQQHRGKTALSVLLMLAGAAAAPLSALALSSLVGNAVAGDRSGAVTAGVALAVCAVAALTCSHFAHIAYFELSELNLLEFERRIIDLSNGSPGLAHHEDQKFADRLTVLQQEVQRFRSGLQALLSLGGLAVAMTLTAVLLARVAPVLLLLPLFALPPLWAGRRAERLTDRARIGSGEQNRLALGLFQLATRSAPAKELRTARLRDEVLRRHDDLWSQATRVLWRSHLASAALLAAGQLVFAAGYIGGVLVVLRDAVQGSRSIADVVLAIALAVQVNQQVSTAFPLLQDLQRIASAFRHLREMRDEVSRSDARAAATGAATRDGSPRPKPPGRLRTGIRFEGVEFRYRDGTGPVLRDVDLDIPAATTVAVVGENGAGKSSLVKLLCGFYQPTAGRILVDGTDLRALSLTAWRERIAAGFQDFARYELTAMEAVGVGDPPRIADEKAVMGALERAHGTSVVDALRDGIHTPLGTSNVDGVDLSGGQWQKLALGRALMRRDPLLVVLDEPTAALDAETEHMLFERYAEQARETAARTGAVTVLVSHRFSTVRMADLIVVLQDGRIAEVGGHAELMRRSGLYAELYGLQARSYT